MDAFDIFKKLSQGAKFKRKSAFTSSENKKVKKLKVENLHLTNNDDIHIKTEPLDELDLYLGESNFLNGDEIKTEDEIKEEKFDETIDRELTLLGSITAAEHGKKKKKNKTKVLDERKSKLLEQEKVNQYRNQLNINIIGRHVPAPIKEFNDLLIGPDLIENLKKCGYETPTPIQKQALPIMLEGRQLLACAPTGSGKTAAFLLPIIESLKEPKNKGFRAVIVCPTRELAKQTQRECARLSEGRGFRIHIISKINQGLKQYGPKSNQKFDILATTPNRLCFLLDQQAISLGNVEWLVIDEADKLFESGLRGFREQLEKIIAACTHEGKRIAMFSATQTVDVSRWCRKNMKGLINVTVGQRNAATDLVDQELLFVGNENGKLLAFRNIVRSGLTPPVLVFVQSKERAQQLFNELIYDGINVDVIHAERTQLQRDNTVKCFREGKIWVLICTELMARGVDFKGVNLVINYDFPPSAIAYIHRVGRAGRAGRKGKAVTFFTVDDSANLRSIAHVLKQSGCIVPEYMTNMKKKKLKKKDRNSVIKRDDITTKPKYEREKKEKNRNKYVKPIPLNEDDISVDKKNKNSQKKIKLIKKKINRNDTVNQKKKISNKISDKLSKKTSLKAKKL